VLQDMCVIVSLELNILDVYNEKILFKNKKIKIYFKRTSIIKKIKYILIFILNLFIFPKNLSIFLFFGTFENLLSLNL